MEKPVPRKVAFIDRDGTLNVTTKEWWKTSAWAFTPKAQEALKKLRDAGFLLALVTNQAGIRRGVYTHEDVHLLHAHMQELLAKNNLCFDAIAYCPHTPDDLCECRKPRTAMARMIETAVGPIDYAASVMVGDKMSDVFFGRSLGMKTFLIRSEYWSEVDTRLIPDYVVSSLYEAAEHIARRGLQ